MHRTSQSLNGTLGDEDDGEDKRDGQQDVDGPADEVDPEVANRLRVLTSESSNECHRDGDAYRSAEEIL